MPLKRLARRDVALQVDLIYRCVLGSQDVVEAARELCISRSKAHELLKQARDQKIIDTVVVLLPDPEDELAHLVREHWAVFGVENVLVLPGPVRIPDRWDFRNHLRANLGALAARYVADLELRPGDHIATSGGRTMVSFAQRFAPREKRLVIRPLASGGRWRPIVHIDADAVVQLLHARLGVIYPPGEGTDVICPEMPPGQRNGLHDRPEVRAVFGKEAPPPRVAITSIGRRKFVPSEDPMGFGPHPDTATYVQTVAIALHYDKKKTQRELAAHPELVYQRLPDAAYREAYELLQSRGVITDVCRHGIDAAGRVVEIGVEHHWLTVHPNLLKSWRGTGKTRGCETIVVVGGHHMVRAVGAVLRGGYFRTVICDTSLALELLPEDRRPKWYFEDRPMEEPEEAPVVAFKPRRSTRGKPAPH